MKKVKTLLIVLMLLLIGNGLVTVAAQSSPNKWAVVVGIGKYPWTSERLACSSDARLMQNILKSKYGFSNRNIKLLLDSEGTKANIFSAIEWLKTNEDAGSTVVFFFAGHGGYGSDQPPLDESDSRDGYLLAADFSIWDDELRDIFASMDSSKVFMLFITCRSGEFVEDLSGEGRIIVSSTTEGGVTVDGKPYSVFGDKFLNKGIKKENADLNKDGLVSMEEAYAYASFGLISDNYEGEMIL